ncbi:DUF1887 family protein [Sulfurimonas sp. SWIR-19]|uniref:Card1-like endonuclease domain-containing protein n=1 Tax=Sulfurimonas sp. SWIR-19 TaxID=2878390 RepID=UPI001CF28C28|nr:DUF1887 family CARF protein [Sulfurimonas sp. SWIR-19]UCN01264.1 DUF1887 family protein [Sulfurimonas sp. SWIR-19]
MTLVSIIGDFHSSVLPVFYEFQNKIKAHIIVYDDARSDTLKAHKIYKGTKRFIQEKKIPIKSYLLKIDEDSQHDLESIKDNILAICEDGSEIVINATDGLANIALYLSSKLLSQGVKFIIYDRFDNSYNLLDEKGMKSYAIEHSMKINEHFMLKDIEIVSQENLDFARSIEQELVNFFEGCHGEKYLYKKYFSSNDKISKTQNGFLYEYYIYNLIKGLNYDDIALGVKIVDTYSQTNAVYNEFDLLIMKENHLHMIECKFIDPLENKVELLYKLDSVRQTLDDDSSLMLLSNEPFYNEEKDNQYFMINSVYKRSHNKKIYLRGSPVCNTARFIKEVDEIFELRTDSFDTLLKHQKKPIKTVEKEQSITLEDITRFLQKSFELDVDFLERKELAKLFNYKMNYPHNTTVHKNMRNKTIREFIRMLNKTDNFKRGNSSKQLFEYFETHFLNKQVYG